MDILETLRETDQREPIGSIGELAADEIERLNNVILRATVELEMVEYDNGPPARVIALLDEMRAINRAAVLGA